MASNKRVLVTGCSGRIGSAVAKQLAQAGHTVFGLDRCAPSLSVRSSLKEFYEGGCEDKELVQRSILAAAPDVVIHLAATPDDAPFVEQLLQPNVVGVVNVLEACGNVKVARIILGSSGKVHSGHLGSYPIDATTPIAPVCLYGATKMFAETAAAQFARNHKEAQVLLVRIAWCPRTPADCDAMELATGIGQVSELHINPVITG